MLTIKATRTFQKDFKTAKKRGYDLRQLEAVIQILISERPLPPKCKDHPLRGNYANYRECHIQPNWLLIYRIDKDTLILYLTRTGTHSDLF